MRTEILALNHGWAEVIIALGGLVCAALFVLFVAGGVVFAVKKGKDGDEGR